MSRVAVRQMIIVLHNQMDAILNKEKVCVVFGSPVVRLDVRLEDAVLWL